MSATRAACVQAKMLSGRYRTDYMISKWSGESGECLLPGCKAPKGDLIHLFSGYCPPLRMALALAIARGLSVLSAHPALLSPVHVALSSSDAYSWTSLILDPSTNPECIRLQQHHGKKFIWPLFRFSRTIVWAIHKERLKLKGQLNLLM